MHLCKLICNHLCPRFSSQKRAMPPNINQSNWKYLWCLDYSIPDWAAAQCQPSLFPSGNSTNTQPLQWDPAEVTMRGPNYDGAFLSSLWRERQTMQNVWARDDPCCIVLMVSEGFHHNGSSCSISAGLNNEAFAVSHFAATLWAAAEPLLGCLGV